MNKELTKCSVEGCEGKIYEAGLCTKHYRRFDRCGDVIGVYKITLKEKVYIGMSSVSIKSRITNEKSGLRTNSALTVSKELLEYFNKLCDEEPEIGRTDMLLKYFDYEILECSLGWYKVDECFRVVRFKDKREQKEKIYSIRISTNEEVQKRNKMMNMFWRSRESIWIKKYKEFDKANGTRNCININD